jgi:hypothetical protein
MKYINYSEQESDLAQIRIGRTNVLESFEPNILLDEMFDLRLDLCRLKVDISNPNIYNLLDDINLPKSNHSFLIEQKIELNKIEKGFEVDIDIQEYDSSKKEALLDVIKQIQNSDTFNIYYQNDIMEKLIPNTILNEIIADYQTTFDNNINKNKNCFLAYKDEKIIGFCTIDTSNNFGEGILVGIVPEYRSLDLFKNFVRTQINYSKKIGCESYICKTIAFNSRSLNTTLKQGMKINRIIMNVNIFPLINYEAKNIQVKSTRNKILIDIIEKIYLHTNRSIKEININNDIHNADNISLNIYNNLNLAIITHESKNKTGYLLLE